MSRPTPAHAVRRIHRRGPTPRTARLPGGSAELDAGTLETLSRRLQPGEAENIGAQLPDEIGRHLTKVDHVERFDWQEFVDHVTTAEELGSEGHEDAAYRAMVVIEVVDEAVDDSVMHELKRQLPAEYDGLFELQEAEATAGPNPEE
ncbi:DUF2267 domain-containing protein [Halobacteria archaeon AArc-dxtr1]|nr:DUF2267 domain-containing protein [Halobacteria archaeon AArc-dxtr1]